MVHFERTRDMRLVRQIIIEPAVWRHIGDDNAGTPADYQPVDHPLIWYVLAFDGAELLGMFAFYPENSITWDVHTCLLPSTAMRPALTAAAARGVIRWVWENTPCRRITTRVPERNVRALHFAQNAGLIEYGKNPMSWLKHGKLHDQILLGISKPEEV